jgi:hypothetical protein
MKDLELFDELSADISLFVQPTFKLAVTDVQSSATAIEVAKTIKSYMVEAEKKRKELVGPLNEQVKAINEYVKRLVAPLEQADQHVRSELNAFANKQEELRKAELARIRKEQEEIERRAREAREQEEAALRAKQEEEAANHEAAAAAFGTEFEDVAEVSLKEKQDREWAEKQAELQRREAMANIEIAQQKFDARGLNVSNARTKWHCEATDLSQVPKEFLIITLNDKAVIAAARAGVVIPGVRVWTEVNVAIGARTKAPREIA